MRLKSTTEELVRTIQKGGKEGERAKEKLVKANLRLIVRIAKRYHHQGLLLTGLIDAGTDGLIKAALEFDVTTGCKFIPFAEWWIRQSILQAVAEPRSKGQLKVLEGIAGPKEESLDYYREKISRTPLISLEEEIELARAIQQGGAAGKRAKARLITANLRFVVSVAKQYQHHELSLATLIDRGNEGLVKAAQLYDDTRGFKFISYAVCWIRQSIIEALDAQCG